MTPSSSLSGTTAPARPVSPLGAVALAIAAYTFWVLADTSLKAAGNSQLPGYQVIGLAGLAQATLLLLIQAARKSLHRLRPRSPWRLCARASLDLANNLCVVVAVRRLPLALFYILVFAAPLLTVLLAALFLKEHLDLRRGLAVLAGFLGVVLAVQPLHAAGQGRLLGYLACAVCVVSFSCNVAWSRVLTQAETPESLTLVSGLVSAAFGLLAMLHRAAPLSLPMAGLLAAIGAFGLCGSLCFFLAIRHAATANVVQFHYTQLITGAALAYLIWHERPTGFMLAGAVLIIGAGVYTAAHSRPAPAEAAIGSYSAEP